MIIVDDEIVSRPVIGVDYNAHLPGIFLPAYCSRRYFGRPNITTQLAPDAQPPETALPKEWMTLEGGDGRARGGRDRVWIVADVVLAIKVNKISNVKMYFS